MIDLSTFKWAAITLEPEIDLVRPDSLSKQPLRRGRGAHRWRLELTSRLLPERQARRLSGLINGAQYGGLGLVHPTRSYSAGTEPAGGLALAGDHSGGTTTLTLTGAHLWQLLAGDLIALATDTKVFEVARDTALASGPQQVQLTSPLRYATAAGVAVRMNGVVLRLIPDSVVTSEEEGANGPLVEHTFVLVEEI